MIYKTIPAAEFETKRKILLDYYRTKQPFRVSIGKSSWIPYEQFDPDYNLREILNEEIVIEFDNENTDLTWKAIDLTAVNLYKAGFCFEIWDHKGKSPHLHVHNLLPCENYELEKRRLFKKLFIRKYVPIEYLPYVDYSLTGVHLIAIEWQNHWKGCYDIKKLLCEFNPIQDKQNETN